MVPHHSTASRTFNANYSILGRIIRRSVRDAHYAEGILILTIALIFISLIVFFYIGWAFAEPIIAADTSGRYEVYYFLAQIGSFGLLSMLTLIGLKPKLEVSLDNQSIHIKQGRKQLFLLTSDILRVDVISAKQFHQHYRKYVNTKAFYTRLSSPLLLMETANEPVILGVSEDEQATLLEAIRSSASTENNLSLEFVA